jgi:hypothetical protein
VPGGVVPNANGDSDGNSHADSYAYANTDVFAATVANTNPYRYLPGNLYDNYYHWHDNPRGHRYRQPLR